MSILTHKYSRTLISYLHKCFTSAGLNPVLVAVQPAVVARGKLGDQFCHFSASFECFSMGERATFFLWNSASSPNVSFLTLSLSQSFSLSLYAKIACIYIHMYIYTHTCTVCSIILCFCLIQYFPISAISVSSIVSDHFSYFVGAWGKHVQGAAGKTSTVQMLVTSTWFVGFKVSFTPTPCRGGLFHRFIQQSRDASGGTIGG